MNAPSRLTARAPTKIQTAPDNPRQGDLHPADADPDLADTASAAAAPDPGNLADPAPTDADPASADGDSCPADPDPAAVIPRLPPPDMPHLRPERD
ncbi:hypothetical protein [Kribbella caucasensis]|uniref:hypothetical protein n=1 Tax=Kribbella caucasensis TaxID=2512215 RepID=UPI001EE044DC|nr:hypothetical protein [Kribbella sp. VKM Ac-2527]